MTVLSMWLSLLAPTASAQVVHLPPGACTGGDDTAAIQRTLNGMRSGEVLQFPHRATCHIHNGLRLGSSRSIGGLTDVTIDGNGATIRALEEMSTDGEVTTSTGTTCDSGSTVSSFHPTFPDSPRYPMLTVVGIDDVHVYDLTLDGNSAARAAYWGIDQSANCAVSANLRVQLVRRGRFDNVTSLDAFADGVFLSSNVEGETVGIEFDRHKSFGAGRNNVTVASCTDCEVRNSNLEGGIQAFDIEPDKPTQRVNAFKVLDSKLADTRGRCSSITSPYDNVTDITLSRNLFTRCALDKTRNSPGRIFAIHGGARNVAITDNHFYNIDVTSIANNRLISLSTSEYTRFERNSFEKVEFNPGSQFLLYLWNDSAGAQATHVFRDNDLSELTPSTSNPTHWWCVHFRNPDYEDTIEAQVYRNYVQDPFGRPGESIAVNGCRGI
jgi:hypothetical protein